MNMVQTTNCHYNSIRVLGLFTTKFICRIKWMNTSLMHGIMKHPAIKHKAFFNNFFEIKMTIQNYHILHNVNNDTPKITFLIEILDGL